jgi:hypothetical protein
MRLSTANDADKRIMRLSTAKRSGETPIAQLSTANYEIEYSELRG